jgi:hypothetical protein
MTTHAKRISIPSGGRLVGAIPPSRIVLQFGEELTLFDVEELAFVARRAIPGLRTAMMNGAWIVVHNPNGPSLLAGDLASDPLGWPSEVPDLRLGGVVGGVAVFTNGAMRLRFDVQRQVVLDQVAEDAEWRASDESTRLLFGVRERAREIVALRPADGAIVWRSIPFASKVDSIGYPQVTGAELHVRASVLDRSRVARLALLDGELLGERDAVASLDSWLPDFGAEVDRVAGTFERRSISYAVPDGIVVSQDDQLVVVRADGVARVALPLGARPVVVGRHAAALIEDAARAELLVLPLPAAGEHDLVAEPWGEDTEASVGDPAVITFVGTSAPIVIVQHPQYGRINLTRDPSSAPPPVGAEVVLDGVTVTPGGTVRVARYWLAGVRPSREPMRFALGPPAITKEPELEATPKRYRASILDRATDAGIHVPDDVLRLLQAVEQDETFRRALATLGFHFDDDELGLDILSELEIEGFVPLWGDGYGDTYGGLTEEGVATLCTDDPTPRVVGSLADHVRERCADAEEDASTEYVCGVLAREKL